MQIFKMYTRSFQKWAKRKKKKWLRLLKRRSVVRPSRARTYTTLPILTHILALYASVIIVVMVVDCGSARVVHALILTVVDHVVAFCSRTVVNTRHGRLIYREHIYIKKIHLKKKDILSLHNARIKQRRR